MKKYFLKKDDNLYPCINLNLKGEGYLGFVKNITCIIATLHPSPRGSSENKVNNVCCFLTSFITI